MFNNNYGHWNIWNILTLSWRRSASFRNQSTDMQRNQWTAFYMIGTSVMKELKVKTLSRIVGTIFRYSSLISLLFFQMFLFDPPENQMFSDIFRGIKSEHLGKNGRNILKSKITENVMVSWSWSSMLGKNISRKLCSTR